MNGSLLIIGSPFQLLCAISAIREYSISEYKLILLETDRLDQMQAIAIKYGLSYEVQRRLQLDRFGILSFIRKVLLPQDAGYDNLIIGDVRDTNTMLKGLSCGSKYKRMIIVDDGNIMLSYFAGTMNLPFKNKIYWYLVKILLLLRSIKLDFFSIYTPTKKRLNVRHNSLNLQIDNTTFSKSVLLFVGTNSSAYCEYFGYSKETYLNVLKSILIDISNNQDIEIQYIAHGREKFTEIREICELLSINYVRPEDCIELYVMNNGLIPKVVYGFCSSALYNLKLMFPRTNVYNIKLFGNEKNKNTEMESICQSYSSIGIIDYDLKKLIVKD